MKKRQAIIVIAFCISFVSMVVLSLFSMERFTTFIEYSDQVYHTDVVIKKIMKTELHLRDIDRGERGYMITRDTMYLGFVNRAIDSIHTLVDEIGAIVNDNPKQRQNMSLVKSSAALRIAAARENIQYVDTALTAAPSRYYYESRGGMIEFSRRLNAMLKEENRLLLERFTNQQFYQKLASRTLVYLLVVFCIITLILFFILIKELRSRVKYQQELQSKIIDLKRSHDELTEIAYAASHDLQEPLRKIQVFSNMLSIKKNSSLDEDSRQTLNKVNSSANRMQALISDLMSLTSLIKQDDALQTVDLNRLLSFILIDIDDNIKAKNARVDIQSLPVLKGSENQLRILFRALLDNSLKFTRDGVTPVIIISSDITAGYELSTINPNLGDRKFYRITCSDNGIGFDNQFISKMFRIFQRLHNKESQYEGKGIGLAICQRVMANHEGYIVANGVPNELAEFRLYFPVDGV